MADVKHSTLHNNKANLHRNFADMIDFTRDANFSSTVSTVDTALKDLGGKVAKNTTDITGIKSTLNSMDSELDDLAIKVAQILANGGGAGNTVIKNIRRGVTKTNPFFDPKVITLSPSVNPDKTVIILNSEGSQSTGGGVILNALTSTSFTISSHQGSDVSYQIIEYL